VTALAKLVRTTAFRLSITYLALSAAAAALVIGYIYWNTTVLLSRQLEQSIVSEMNNLSTHYRRGGLDRLTRIVIARSRTPGDRLYFVSDPKGERLAGNLESVKPDLLNAAGRIEFFYSRQGQDHEENRLAYANVVRLAGDYRLIVGRDIEDRREFAAVVRTALGWGLIALVLIWLTGGVLVSRNLLKRIDAVTETSRRIMAGDLTGRLPVAGTGDELDRLADSLNLMLARIEQLMIGMREVSDNIAHDLKTPLSRLRNRVETALREKGDAEAYRETLEQTIEEADDLIKTFNALLSIARLEAGAAGENMRDLDLAALTRDTVELYEPLAEERGFKLEAERIEPVHIHGERQLIGQALANLIDNAIKYGGDSGGANVTPDIRVSAYRANGSAAIEVSDSGAGIPEDQRAHVVKRFVRLEASRSEPGSGLGLSLVAAVARLHGGRLDLDDNRPGLKAVLTLPLAKGEAVRHKPH
jgi:signal transduction histidine kinase